VTGVLDDGKIRAVSEKRGSLKVDQSGSLKRHLMLRRF
jgi:hypothetical protein